MQNTTLPDTALAIIIGVVSGIITAAIIWSLAQVVKKNVIPWYRKMIYKGFDVSGTWVQPIDDRHTQTGEFILKQRAEQLEGTCRPERLPRQRKV